MEKLKKINFGAVLVENGDLSLGRVSFWACFGLSCYMWAQGLDIPQTLMTVTMTLIAYNLGKKVRDIANVYVSKSTSPEKK